jgi:hypothetical protein
MSAGYPGSYRIDVEMRHRSAEISWKGHVNNVVYNRYAETARIQWAMNYARFIDPSHSKVWTDLCSSRGEGLILSKITTKFKFVRCGFSRRRVPETDE